MDAFFSFLKVAIIGIFALVALVLVLLAIPQTRFKSTLTEILAWFGFLGASGLVASPVDLIPDFLPVIGWTDDLGYALLAAGLRLYRVEPAPPQADRPASQQAGTPALLQGDHAALAWLARHAGEAQPLDECRARDRSLAHGLSDRSEGSGPSAPCPLPFPASDSLTVTTNILHTALQT